MISKVLEQYWKPQQSRRAPDWSLPLTSDLPLWLLNAMPHFGSNISIFLSRFIEKCIFSIIDIISTYKPFYKSTKFILYKVATKNQLGNSPFYAIVDFVTIYLITLLEVCCWIQINMADPEEFDVEDPRIQNRLEEMKEDIRKEIRKELRVKEGVENMKKVCSNYFKQKYI